MTLPVVLTVKNYPRSVVGLQVRTSYGYLRVSGLHSLVTKRYPCSNSQEFEENFKHPVILPKKSSIVELIIHDAHKKVAHAGRGITLNELGYWILDS